MEPYLLVTWFHTTRCNIKYLNIYLQSILVSFQNYVKITVENFLFQSEKVNIFTFYCLNFKAFLQVQETKFDIYAGGTSKLLCFPI